ncbi:MAG: DUF1524 domain-containing protein [Rhodococcus sp.]|nr:DUF1524 domain-containing protein [Rhodococcus sp. (in: high G+C Gram-positive bacteria)]
MQIRNWRRVAAALAGVTIVASGCTDPVSSSESAPSAAEVTTASSAELVDVDDSEPVVESDVDVPLPVAGGDDAFAAALAQLATLEIKGRAPKTGYSRDLFGQRWSDAVDVEGGHNGCDTRNDILQRDLVGITFKPGTRNCVVASGTLHDPYTGQQIEFVRGNDTSTAVQIDHVVALSDAWQKGAQQLDAQTRANFANDPLNLRAVDGPTNARKGDSDAATWLPPNRAFRCTYVADQVAVKARYQLWVTQAEHDAIARVLGECGAYLAQAQPVSEPTPEPTPQPVPEPTPEPVPEPTPPAPAAESSSVYFANCAAARAAGAAPLYAGSPGYRPALDRDRDGIACE